MSGDRELVERLNREAEYIETGQDQAIVQNQPPGERITIADLSATLPLLAATRLESLIEVLEPFAKYGRILQGQRVSDDAVLLELWDTKITVKDLRNAAALSPHSNDSGEEG